MKMDMMKKYMKRSLLGIAAAGILFLSPLGADAHCDTMDGPTVKDGLKAMETNNINYALKWVQPEYEGEVSQAFKLSMKVKDQNEDTKNLAEQYFLEILLRTHRAGEGAPFDGVKPHGVPIDERVKAADQSIAVGNLSPMGNLVEQERMPELKERFDRVMALRNFDVNDLEAGREYIEAYVQFFKFAEGEEDEHHGAHAGHGAEAVHGHSDASHR